MKKVKRIKLAYNILKWVGVKIERRYYDDRITHDFIFYYPKSIFGKSWYYVVKVKDIDLL